MKTKQTFISFESDYCSVEIIVPNLGVVKIENFLSAETKERIAKEVEEAVRPRLYAPTDFGKFGRWND